ncbi:MAG: hypothetical protein GY774_14330 [Planctomycetes bacterium]|nr:hypothetical protein [Planctomycetota bacterium]
MIRTVKFGKIALVIFLTILIWVWTDLYLDEPHTVPRSTISVAHSPELLVSFSGQPEAVITNIELKGPAKKIHEVKRDLDDGTLELDFTLNPERENMITTGSHTLNVLDFLKRSDKIKELGGLTVEDCKPDRIDVNVVKLVTKSLEIECFDENGVPVTVESKIPDKVDMYVPEDSRLKARIRLTSSNINQARLSEAVVTPYVELAPGRERPALQTVRIKMSPEADSLTEHLIEDASLAITLSKNLQGAFYVDIPNSNYNDLVSSFFIYATLEAKNAYENQEFQIYLIIPDDYAKKPNQEQRRDVVYIFPEEYVRRDEIRLKGEPKVAEFKLIPLSSAEVPTPGTN